MADDGHMADFWDARAREDAYFFVDDRLDYGSPDTERFWAGGDETIDAIFARLGIALDGSEVVLDVGCGVGRLTRALAGRARAVIGIDVSSEMLVQARELNAGVVSNASWVQGDGVSLAGVDDGAVDAVVSHVVFQHIPDPAVTLGYVREMGRVLHDGGWAAFQVSNDAGVHRPAGLGVRARALVGRGPRGQEDPAWVGSAVDLDDLGAAAAAGGAAIERVEGAGTQFCHVLLRAGA